MVVRLFGVGENNANKVHQEENGDVNDSDANKADSDDLYDGGLDETKMPTVRGSTDTTTIPKQLRGRDCRHAPNHNSTL